jgi:KUP system potassium uptake protein
MVFGFMEEPNVERVLEQLAGHHEIDLPADPHKWIVHASAENVMPAKGVGVIGRVRVRLFAVLRQVSQPAYYYYGLGNEVQLSTEIMPVKLR